MTTDRHSQAGTARTGLLRAFRRDQSGATAVEFALVAIPFFALMFAILQTALVFFAGQAMETAVANAARLIRTGQAQQQGLTAEEFKEQICTQIFTIFDCMALMHVDVETFETFDSINLSNPLDEEGNFEEILDFEPGAGGEIVVVRAFYEWPVIAGMLGLDLSNTPNGTHLLTATAAFRNEPFTW